MTTTKKKKPPITKVDRLEISDLQVVNPSVSGAIYVNTQKVGAFTYFPNIGKDGEPLITWHIAADGAMEALEVHAKGEGRSVHRMLSDMAERSYREPVVPVPTPTLPEDVSRLLVEYGRHLGAQPKGPKSGMGADTYREHERELSTWVHRRDELARTIGRSARAMADASPQPGDCLGPQPG